MVLPRAVARFNHRYTDRLIQPIARRSKRFGVVQHRGRRSGKGHRTPVYLFALDADTFVVSLTYGPSADWVQNVLASGGHVEMNGAVRAIRGTRSVSPTEARPGLPVSVRFVTRVLGVQEFLRLELLANE